MCDNIVVVAELPTIGSMGFLDVDDDKICLIDELFNDSIEIGECADKRRSGAAAEVNYQWAAMFLEVEKVPRHASV